MKESSKKKILFFNELLEVVKHLKEEGKVVVQSHGVFDIIHPGILQHLNSAKKQGDVLIVTVIKDKDIRKGPGRPLFPENFRAETLASLEQVDYVCLVDDETPFECIKRIQPDVFAKGQLHKEEHQKIHENVFKDNKELYFGKSKIYETGGFSFSSSKIINDFLDIYPEETRQFLKDFSKKYSFDDIVNNLNSLKDMKILLIGDGIIDEYHYCSAMDKALKALVIVNRYLTHEVFLGGAFAIANHIAGLCDNVELVTLLGTIDSRKDFILDNLKPNIKPTLFYRQDAPTILKKRYVHQYTSQKLFEINYLDDSYINRDCEQEVVGYLESKIPEYDLILVSDFGHGFITEKIINTIQKKAKIFAVNTQTNSANSGYNMITKYWRPHYVCLDETEVRLAAQDKYAPIEEVAEKITKLIEAGYFIVTMGRRGSIGVSRQGETNHTPIFSSKVVDTIGAGDAFFAFTAPCFAKGMPLDFVSFIGNAVGALAVQIVCNKKPVEKHELLEFLLALYR